MAKRIDPKVDFACKRVLGSPEHPAITLHFLNAMLGGNPSIADVEILNPNLEPRYENDKYAILDVRARNNRGDRFNIEIQRTRPAGLPERLAYYASSQLVEQLGAGQGYGELRPSIGICLLDAILFPQSDDFLTDFRMMNGKHGHVLTDHLQIHVIELPKYVSPRDNWSKVQFRIDNAAEQWCFFFNCAQYLPQDELLRCLPHPVFAEAMGVLEMISRDPDERRLYEDRLKFERDVRAKEEYARQEGLAAGRAEGIAQGIAEGIAEGLTRGELIGKIKLLRQLVGEASMTDREFEKLSLDGLADLEQELQRRLRERL